MTTAEVAVCRQFWRVASPGRRGGDGYEGTTTARLILARSGGRREIVITNPWE